MATIRQRKQNLLTELSIKAKKEPGRYSDGNGLYLVVRPGGSKQWMFLYRRQGRLREMGLGSPSAGITLAKARQLAAEARGHTANGNDPLEARRLAEQEIREAPKFG